MGASGQERRKNINSNFSSTSTETQDESVSFCFLCACKAQKLSSHRHTKYYPSLSSQYCSWRVVWLGEAFWVTLHYTAITSQILQKRPSSSCAVPVFHNRNTISFTILPKPQRDVSSSWLKLETGMYLCMKIHFYYVYLSAINVRQFYHHHRHHLDHNIW